MSIDWSFILVSNEPRAIGVGKSGHSFILTRADFSDPKPGSLMLWHSTAKVDRSGRTRAWSGASGYSLDSGTIARALSGQLGPRVIRTLGMASEVLPRLVEMHPDLSAHERIRLGVLLRDLSAHFEQTKHGRSRAA